METQRRYGWQAAARRLIDRAARRGAALDPAHLLWVETTAVPPQQSVAELGQFAFLSPRQVAEIVAAGEAPLDAAFVDRARRGHDLCYALYDGDELLHYGWCALGSIDPEFFAGSVMSFPPHMVYVYNVYTPPQHRGRRLNGACLAAALTALRPRGVTGCLAAVHWTNEPSLRSFRRLGAVDWGLLVTARVAGRRLEKAPRKAKQQGVCFGPEAYLGERRFPRGNAGCGSPLAAEPALSV